MKPDPVSLTVTLARYLAAWLVFAGCWIQVNANPDTVLVYDRFGISYPIEQIRIPEAGSPEYPANECVAGLFHLYYTDGPNAGFNNLTNGAVFRDVACRVFSDLSELLVAANNPYTGLPNTSDLVNISLHSYTGGNPLIAGVGGSYYNEQFILLLWNPLTNNGIVDGEVWKTINGGLDSYEAFGNFYPGGSYYHGDVVINFIPGFTWNLSYQAATPAGEVDLYTVMLYEAIHALGFVSLIDATGSSVIAGTVFYSRYDTYLHLDNGGLGPLLNNPFSCGNVAYSGSSLTGGCDTRFIGQNNEPVVAPSPFSQGESLSHFDENCTPFTPYVMSNGGMPGVTRRHPTQNDADALCDLGYTTTSTYGVSGTGFGNFFDAYVPCGGRIAGVDDIFYYNTFNLYTYVDGQPPILINDFLQNDEDESSANGLPVGFDCLSVMNGIGNLSNITANSFEFSTPAGFNGWSVLRYIPVAGNGGRGNLTYI